jgi:hypothetical protein
LGQVCRSTGSAGDFVGRGATARRASCLPRAVAPKRALLRRGVPRRQLSERLNRLGMRSTSSQSSRGAGEIGSTRSKGNSISPQLRACEVGPNGPVQKSSFPSIDSPGSRYWLRVCSLSGRLLVTSLAGAARKRPRGRTNCAPGFPTLSRRTNQGTLFQILATIRDRGVPSAPE